MTGWYAGLSAVSGARVEQRAFREEEPRLKRNVRFDPLLPGELFIIKNQLNDGIYT
jgi:hypothetical protein